MPHKHPASEDCVFILEGEGSVQDVAGERLLGFKPGDAIFIPAGLPHGTLANKGQRVVSVGGPTPPDLEMLKLAGAEIA